MCRRARCEFWCPTGGCLAEPGDHACAEAREAMEADPRVIIMGEDVGKVLGTHGAF